MSNICRTCMSKEQEMISIFNQGKSPSITDMIMAISAVEFSAGDTLPPQMCITCYETLEIAFYFKNQVIRINNALHGQAQTSKLLAPQVIEEEEIEESEDVCKEHIEISAENITLNAELPSKCPELLISSGIYDPSAEKDIKSLNRKLSLNRKSHDDDSHFDEICIKTEETNESNRQFEDTCKIISHPFMCKKKTDEEFCSEDDLPLTWLHVRTGSSIDVQHYSNKNVSRKPSKGDPPYKCAYCKKLFHQESTFTSHLNEHKRRNKCDVCEQTFLCRQNLISHMRRHTGETPYKCQDCNASFKHMSSLKNHTRLHTGETRPKPYKCEDCGKTYGKPCLLKEHMRTHTGERPFQCQICNARFRLAFILRNHIRLHADGVTPKPYMCDICGKSFYSNNNLTEHIRVHTGEKPFKCQFCKASFAQRGTLNKHIRLHAGKERPKPHKCEVCGKTFASAWYLKQHMLCHSVDRPFRCQDCNAGFNRRGNLNRHILLHTGDARTDSKS